MFNFALGAGGANIVVPFQSRPKAAPAQKGWGQDEIAEAYRVIDLLARGGLAVHLVSGLSDEGDPWAAVLRDDNEDVVVHFARIDGRVILVSATSERVFSGHSLAAALRSVLEVQPLILPAGGGGLFLHPATILAAFIATALVNVATDAVAAVPADAARDAQARVSQDAATAGARGSDGGYSPALLAAAIASVATAFTLTMDETRLFDDGSALEPIHAEAKHLVGAEPHIAPDQITWGLALGEPLGLLRAQQTFDLGAASAQAEAVTTPEVNATALLEAVAYLKNLGEHTDGVPSLGANTWRLAFETEYQTAQAAIAGVAPLEAAPLDVADASEALPNGESSIAEGKGAGAAMADHPGFILAGGESFYWEARFLLGMASPPDTSFVGPAVFEASQAQEHLAAATGQARAAANDPAVFTVSMDVAADVRASILKEFTQDAARELPADAVFMGQVLASLKALPFLPDVDRVVLFEADDVTTDIFMMFKGVAMVRGDLLGEDLHQLAPSQQVAFEMTNGESFRLLGVVDV